MGKGAHIYAGRGVYAHHGIDIGDGTVIHYQGKAEGGQISQDLISSFSPGKQIYEIKHKNCNSPDTTVKLAYEKFNQQRKNYHLFNSNCEHFAYWCKTQKNKSDQIGGVVTPLVSSSTAAAVPLMFGAGIIATPVAILAGLTSVGIYTYNIIKKEESKKELKKYDQDLLKKIEEYYRSWKITYEDARKLLQAISTGNMSVDDAYKQLDILLSRST